MFDFIYRFDDATIFLILTIVTTFFSLFVIVLNRIFKLYHLKYQDNTATASVASMIGITYGLLTGVVCLYLLGNQNHAENAALNEGTAAANLYRESQWLHSSMQTKVQSDLKKYIIDVTQQEWPAMTQGREININQSAVRYINSISTALMHYPITNQSDALVVNNLLQSLRDLFKARQERIEISTTQLSVEIWVVILLSSALIIFMNHTLRLDFKLHIFSLIAMAIMTASVLFLLITLDRPFQGEFIVEPDALRGVLHLMEQNSLVSQNTTNR
jgi:hypothetical protein